MLFVIFIMLLFLFVVYLFLNHNLHNMTIASNQSVKADSISDFSDKIISSSQDFDTDLNYDNSFSTKRLIVSSSDGRFNTYGAKDVYEYDDLYVLMYDSVDKAKSAYQMLLSDDNVDNVDIDSVIENSDADDIDVKDSDSNSGELSDTELKIHLDGLIPNKKIKVAILDTGLNVNDVDSERVIDSEVNLSSTGNVNSTSDDNGHGTDMANIILSNGGEYVYVVPIKIANSDGKTTVLSTYLGIKEAINANANIINISMNALMTADSKMLESIINEATGNGIPVVVSAGNNSHDVADIIPSNISSATVVSAINSDNKFADYSNYGSTIDYSAYGFYNGKNGTSYAAASVAGIMANVLSKGETLPILDEYAIDLGDMYTDNHYGVGFVGFSMYNMDDFTGSDVENEKLLTSYENWKLFTDDELNEFLGRQTDRNNAIFLQSLSEDDLKLIISKDTCLLDEYPYYVADPDDSTGKSMLIEREIYYKYLLALDVSDLNISATYGTDLFGGDYSQGYIRNRNSNTVKDTSGCSIQSGEALGGGKNYTGNYYSNNNTSFSDSVYVTYSNAARYVDSSGNPKWLDMRVYLWTNTGNWALATTKLSLYALSNSGSQKISVRLRFYESGHGGEAAYEKDFKGVICFSDIDTQEGYLFTQGVNRYFRTSDNWLKHHTVNTANHTNANNPFTADVEKNYDYFYGTVGTSIAAGNNESPQQSLWVEINSTTSVPLTFKYGSVNSRHGSPMFYTGTAIEYYISGTHKDTSYCVPYGTYALLNPGSCDGQKKGYTVNGWYTDSACTQSATMTGNAMGGDGTTVKVYGNYVPINYTMTLNHYKWNPNRGDWDYWTTTTAIAAYDSTYTPDYASTPVGYYNYSRTYNDGWKVTGDGTFYLYYYPNTYTQTMNHYKNYGGGGWQLFSTTTASALYSTTFTPSYTTAPTGYYASSRDWNTGWTVTGAGTFSLYYQPIEYNIKFDANKPSKASSSVTGTTSTMTGVKYDMSCNLTNNGYSLTGWIFTGWNSSPDGRGTPYSNGQSIKNLTTVDGATITMYAQWRPITYTVQFNNNEIHGSGKATGTMSSIVLTYDEPSNLPANQFVKTTAGNIETEGGTISTRYSTYKGWSRVATDLRPTWVDKQSVVNLTTKDKDVITFYAIWDDSPDFIITEYPNRHFTLDEAQTGYITEDELFSTLTVVDRETNPLVKKTAVDVARTGNDRGITIPNYDASEFTSLQDDSVVLVTYQLKDESDNTAYLNIRVTISNNEPSVEPDTSYVRSISDKYYEKDAYNGGLNSSSKWLNDGLYSNKLNNALTTNSYLYRISLSKSDIEFVKQHINNNGFGNSEKIDALQDLFNRIK